MDPILAVREQVFIVGGVSFTGTDVGADDAHPVVLLHGNGGSWVSFRPLIKLLAARHRVIAFDQRGFGGSAPSPGALDYLRMADDTAAFLASRNVDSAVVVGVSMGAGVLQALAVRHPQVVGGALYAALGRIDRNHVERERSTLPPAVRASLIERRMPTEEEIRESAEFVFGSRTRRERPELIDAAYAKLRTHDWAAAARSGFATHGLDALHPSKMRAPALVLVGEEDRCVPLEHAREFADELPDAELMILPETGHAVLVEGVAEVHTAIRHLESRLT